MLPGRLSPVRENDSRHLQSPPPDDGNSHAVAIGAAFDKSVSFETIEPVLDPAQYAMGGQELSYRTVQPDPGASCFAMRLMEQPLEPEFPSNGDIELALSSTLGLYSTGDMISKGGFGKVMIFTNSIGTRYAVKILGLNKDRRWQKMDRGEINAFLARKHNNIIRTHSMLLFDEDKRSFHAVKPGVDLASLQKQPFEVQAVVCELISGPNLGDAIGDISRGISPADHFKPEASLACRLGSKISNAVAHMHEQGLIYRDLKLDNIVIDQKSGDIKLIDFGFSRRLDLGSTTHTFCGSAQYLAPELILLRRKDSNAPDGYDHKVDAWSLGVVLLQLTCDQVPGDFTVKGIKYYKSKKKVLDNILWFAQKSDAAKKLYLNCRITQEFKGNEALLDIIVKLLRKDPEMRMSVEEARIKLDEISKASAPAPSGTSAI